MLPPTPKTVYTDTVFEHCIQKYLETGRCLDGDGYGGVSLVEFYWSGPKRRRHFPPLSDATFALNFAQAAGSIWKKALLEFGVNRS